MGIGFMQLVKQSGLSEKTDALRDLATIARKFPDLFAEVCRTFLAENGEPPRVEPQPAKPAPQPPAEPESGNAEARGSAGTVKPDPKPAEKPKRKYVRKSLAPRSKNGEALYQVILEHGPMRPTAAALTLRKHPNEMTRCVKRDPRFYKEDGLIKIRPEAATSPSPTSPATSGSTG